MFLSYFLKRPGTREQIKQKSAILCFKLMLCRARNVIRLPSLLAIGNMNIPRAHSSFLLFILLFSIVVQFLLFLCYVVLVSVLFFVCCFFFKQHERRPTEYLWCGKVSKEKEMTSFSHCHREDNVAKHIQIRMRRKKKN
jgi:hypothetical protein